MSMGCEDWRLVCGGGAVPATPPSVPRQLVPIPSTLFEFPLHLLSRDPPPLHFSPTPSPPPLPIRSSMIDVRA